MREHDHARKNGVFSGPDHSIDITGGSQTLSEIDRDRNTVTSPNPDYMTSGYKSRKSDLTNEQTDERQNQFGHAGIPDGLTLGV